MSSVFFEIPGEVNFLDKKEYIVEIHLKKDVSKDKKREISNNFKFKLAKIYKCDISKIKQISI